MIESWTFAPLSGEPWTRVRGESVPAFMLVYLPFPSMGVTVATLDKAGNLSRIELDNILRAIGLERKIDAIKEYRAATGAYLKDALRAIELAMPRKPDRGTPDEIATAIISGLGSDWWAESSVTTVQNLRQAIAVAIRAERS